MKFSFASTTVTRNSKIALTSMAIGVSCLFGLGGCPKVNTGNSDPNSTGTQKAVLKPFGSRSELLSYLAAQATASSRSSNNYLLGGGLAVPSMAEAGNYSPNPTGGVAADAAAGSSSAAVHSTTNLQEVGVDESDVFKSDGKYFYLARNNTLRIVQAAPGQALAEVGELSFNAQITDLYLTDAGLLALGPNFDYTYGGVQTMIYPPYYSGGQTIIYQVDISNPTQPTLVKQTKLDGMLAASRVVNNQLVLVLTIYPNISGVAATTVLGIPTGDNSAAAGALPKVSNDSGESEIVSWENWLHPDVSSGYEMTVVAALKADDIETIVSSTGVVGGAETIYASPNALYVTDSAYDESNNYRESTNVHKFAFQSDGSVQYAASGNVPGRPLNQFSLSEYQGQLRIATHINNMVLYPPLDTAIPIDFPVINLANAQATDASPPDTSTSSSGSSTTDAGTTSISAYYDPNTYNGVYVLSETDGELATIGRIDNIAPNEKIYSARFLEQRGYLVTFRQIDPLFSLDLSNPTAPKVTGELKIPGYSDYLHPLDDNHLIGVGHNVVNFPQGFSEPGGVQLSLFDVSDPNNPQVVQQLVMGGYGSSTDVSYNHKAFVYVPELKILSIPVQLAPLSNDMYTYGYPTFDGVVAFSVDPSSGFTEIGKLSSVLNSYEYYYSYPVEGDVATGSAGASDSSSGGASPPSTIAPGAPGYLTGYANWRRPALISNSLFAVTDAGVTRGDLGDLAHPESLTLNP